MKKIKLAILLSLICLSSGVYAEGKASQDWQINNIPSSFNKDKTIYIFSGRAQILTFSLKSIAANLGKDYPIKLEFALPAKTQVYGVEALRTKKFEQSTKNIDGMEQFTVEFEFNRIMLQNKDERESEWQNIQIVIKVPEDCPSLNILKVKLFVKGQYIDTFEWPMMVDKLTVKGSTLKLVRLGFWDYGINRCEFAAGEIVDFLSSIGINYNQAFINRGIGPAKSPIIYGGDMHQSSFANTKYPDFKCDGKAENDWGYCSPQAVITHGATLIDGGIKAMLTAARSQSGITTIDYEPTGMTGFSKESIELFLKESGVSAEDFKKFRDEYAEEKYSMIEAGNPLMNKIYKRWIAFRSRQDQEFIGVISRELKKNDPSIKFELSCHPTIGDEDISSLTLGHNNGAMAKYLDGIMPQIYVGYGNVAAKSLALAVRQWKAEIQKLNTDCKLYPVLLVRYAAASVFNSPERVRQQTIGAIAEGADGVVYYYAQQMNSKYYTQIAKISNELAVTEEFYKKGIRADLRFKPANMLQGRAQLEKWPGYIINVENPDWHYTAHQLDDKILLTLFNYSEKNDLVFNFARNSEFKIEKIYNCEDISTKPEITTYLLAPQDVGYIVLKLVK